MIIELNSNSLYYPQNLTKLVANLFFNFFHFKIAKNSCGTLYVSCDFFKFVFNLYSIDQLIKIAKMVFIMLRENNTLYGENSRNQIVTIK